MSDFVDRGTNLRWRVLAAKGTAEEASALADAFTKEHRAEGWRQPTFEEVAQCLTADGKLSFGSELLGVWSSGGEKRGLDTREEDYVAKANADGELAAVVITEVKAKRPAERKRRKFVVQGYLDNAAFQKVSEASEYLNREYASEYAITVTRMFAFEFEKARVQMIADGKIGDTHSVVVSCEEDATYMDGEQFLKEVVRTTDFRLFDLPDEDPSSYLSLARNNLMTFLRSTGSTYCWMLVRIGDMVQGRIVFQLHSAELPRTCENFMHLCRGDLPDAESNGKKIKLHYKGSTFFRVVKNGWIQGGDISGQSGNGGFSVYGRTFPDESFKMTHDGPGVLGMANDGEHTNSSSFYITTAKSSWMNGKYVAFGRVVEGLSVVEAIHNVETKHNQGPRIPVVIQDCGYLSMD